MRRKRDQHALAGIWDLRRQRKGRCWRTDDTRVIALQRVIPKNASIVDIGASTGAYLRALKERGFHGAMLGLDGTDGIEDLTDGLVQRCDLLDTSACEQYSRCAEWGIFCEVGEHIPRHQELALIQNVSLIPRRWMIVSWGKPRQRGRGHVNNRTDVHIAQQFLLCGWKVNDKLTAKIRKYLNPAFAMKLMVLHRDD